MNGLRPDKLGLAGIQHHSDLATPLEITLNNILKYTDYILRIMDNVISNLHDNFISNSYLNFSSSAYKKVVFR